MRAAGRVLVATDFDGTLMTVADTPDGVLLDASAQALLQRIAERADLAVLSGRRMRDLAPHLRGVRPVWLVAEHGAELVAPGDRARARPPDPRAHALSRSAEELARIYPGAHVEAKNHSVALHYREVAPALRRALVDGFALACRVHEATPLQGRMVLEGRLSPDDKGVALARILARLPRETLFVYAGDDTTDEPAIELAARSERGLGLYVRSDERPHPSVVVDGVLEGAAAWMEILDVLAARLGPTR